MELENAELFISHASEDKESLVRPLSSYLRSVGVRVWYDEFTLTAGDSLLKSIDRGLSMARYGLVVVSPHFTSKPWPEYELRGLNAKEIGGGGKVVIPVWHNISHKDVLEFSPPLADKVAVVTDGKTIEDVALDILRAIRPDLSDRLSLLRRLMAHRSKDDMLDANLDDIAPAPVPAVIDVESHIVIRAMNVANSLGVANRKIVGDPSTFLIDLCRDVHPEVELRVWEKIAAAYLRVDRSLELTAEQREESVAALLNCSFGSFDWVDRTDMSKNIVVAILKNWKLVSDLTHHDRVQFAAKHIPDDIDD